MSRIKLYFDYLKRHSGFIAKLFTFSFIALFFIGRSFNAIDPYPTGDGPEYILVTEALYNHSSSDIRPEDCESFKKSYEKIKPWNGFVKQSSIEKIKGFVGAKQLKLGDFHDGIYSNGAEHNYSYHFFFYSLVNLPGRFINEWVGADPMKSFIVTNAFLVVLTCFFLLFFSTFSVFLTITIAFCFCFSSAYWYLGWVHPEVYTVCFVTLGCWFFFQDRLFLGLLLVVIASLQNQPLFVLVIFMGLKILLQEKFTLKLAVKLLLIGLLFLWPSLFYYFHFGTTNLIKDAGFLDTAYITSTRVFGFYFDVNQGMILAIPLALLVYFFVVIRYWILFSFKREKFNYDMLLLFFILAMSCVVATMGNWNHGQAIINRYATWFSAIILIHIFDLLKKWNERTMLITMNYIFFSQIATTLYHEQFNLYDWGQIRHKPLAEWFISYHSDMYNPDPQIFIIRTTSSYNINESVSPVFFIRKDNVITKIAVHENRMDSLVKFGFPQQKINEFKAEKSFVNGWAYLNRGDFDVPFDFPKVRAHMDDLKIRGFEIAIRNSPQWMRSIELKAKAANLTIDEMIRLDAKYLYEVQKSKEQ